MFYYFNGEVTLLESNLAVIDCGGVGYACRTSSYTLSRLHVGERARLYTYCSIREDLGIVSPFGDSAYTPCIAYTHLSFD